MNAVVPAMGPALLLEYEDVLARSEIFWNARLSESERTALFEIFMSKASWTEIYFVWRPNLRDNADNHLVDLAVAAGAERIVTNNVRDFVDGELKFDHIRVITPGKLIEELAL